MVKYSHLSIPANKHKLIHEMNPGYGYLKIKTPQTINMSSVKPQSKDSTTDMLKIVNPYHGITDSSKQVNRFLEPMKNYARANSQNIERYGRHYTEEDKTHPVVLEEYNSIKFLYGSEEDHAKHNAFKQKAINATHEYVMDKVSKFKRDQFHNAQYELREFRGQYIAKQTKANTEKIPFGYTQQIDGFKNGYSLVEFNCTKEGNDVIPIPILSRVDEMLDIFRTVDNDPKSEIMVEKVVDIIDNSQHRILSLWNDKTIDVEILKRLFKAVKDDVKRNNSPDYFKFLESDLDRRDDLARKEIRAGELIRIDFKSPPNTDTSIKYKFAVNMIIPTKTKIEHNVKTVHRFGLDFKKILNPIHIDLVIEMNDFEFTWTIYEFENSKHQIYHAGYFSNDNRLFDMPGTLGEMTERFEKNNEEYMDVVFRKATIDTARIDRNDHMSLLNLHIYALRERTDDINADHKILEYPSHPNDVGYIYRYNHYTIIASGIKHPLKHKDSGKEYEYANFYTIIHWNNTPFFKDSRFPVVSTTSSTNDVQFQIEKLNTHVKGLDNQIGHLIENRMNPIEAALDEVKFYIPSIQKKPTGIKSQEVGVLLVECTNEDKRVIDFAFKREKYSILRDSFDITISRGEKSPNPKMINYLVRHNLHRRGERINDPSGVFGYFLKKTHEAKNDGHKSALEIWSDYWYNYFEFRPEFDGKVRFDTGVSKEAKTINAHNEDKAIKSAQRKYHYEKQKESWYQTQQERAFKDMEANRNFWETFPPITRVSKSSHKRDKSSDVVHKDQGEVLRVKTEKKPLKTHLRLYAPRMRLAATAPEFVPQDHTLKMQAEIDALKRTLNELTLRAL